MRIEGVIKSWNDERGFGFIEPVQGGQEIFLHVKAFRVRHGRPQPGQYVSFAIEVGPKGKKRAKDVELVRVARTRGRDDRTHAPGDWGVATLLAIPAFAVVFVAVAFAWHVPKVVAAVYVVMSVVCFGMYAVDKSAAKTDRRRVSEGSLHMVALLGGWPGALIAQQFLRHKSTKTSFRQTFWGTVVINVVGFVFLCSPLAGKVLNSSA